MKTEVKNKFDSYPEEISILLYKVRQIILDIVEEENLTEFEETLKWGEPSYLAKGASTVRIDWKSKTPAFYYIYFNCKTKLVETFREIYGDILVFEGNRAIVLNVNEELPIDAIKHCISLSLKYQSIKHLNMLGE